MYGDRYHVAPLSVLVDPLRALRVLGLEGGRSFSPKVVYVYNKQLEEADVIVINKLDIVTGEQRDRLTAALRERYQAAMVLNISAKTGENLDAWFEHILATQANTAPQEARAAIDVDYDIYAEGEALLGWLNATVRVAAAAPLDGNRLLADVARGAHAALAAAGLEIAHLKMTLAPDEGADIAALNLVRTDGTPEMSHLLADDIADAEMIVNLRAEGDPDRLRAVVERAIDEAARAHAASCAIVHCEHFRPARPQPTHRLAALIDQ
jgi:hypothetical protein